MDGLCPCQHTWSRHHGTRVPSYAPRGNISSPPPPSLPNKPPRAMDGPGPCPHMRIHLHGTWVPSSDPSGFSLPPAGVLCNSILCTGSDRQNQRKTPYVHLCVSWDPARGPLQVGPGLFVVHLLLPHHLPCFHVRNPRTTGMKRPPTRQKRPTTAHNREGSPGEEKKRP